MSSEKLVTIETDLPSEGVRGLATFFERFYLQINRKSIDQSSYQKTELDGSFSFSWKLNIHYNDQPVSLFSELRISPGSVQLGFRDLDNTNLLQRKVCDRTIDDVQAIVSSYVLNTRVSSLYFVIGADHEKHSEAPTQEGGTQRSVLRRVFAGSSTNVFLAFTAVSFILFFVIGFFALFVLLGLQLVYLLFSDRLILNMGNVRPSAERPFVSVVSVRSTPETIRFLRRQGRKILAEIRDDVSRLHLPPMTSGSIVTDSREVKSSILPVLSEHGIRASPDDVEIRTKNVYGIVKGVAEKFSQPVPKIVISNTVVSNAAAVGVSKKRSSIMITAGSIEDLTDEELESVVGHELGHVKGHDPLIMFAVSSISFVGLYYLWYSLAAALGIFYFFVPAFVGIYAMGKVLETRADTMSAVVLGDPMVLAASLRKMGFRQLYREKYSPQARLFDWFRFDPHPPLYFRVSRMSEFVDGKTGTSHAFLVSLRDCIVGFFSAFT
jgi:heat shock protein HtpX